MILAGTDLGLQRLDDGVSFPGRKVTSLAGGDDEWWAILDRREVWPIEGSAPIASLSDHRANCLLAARRGLIVGTSEARLFQITEGRVEPLGGFDAADGRGEWFTPWRGPPDARSIAEGREGTLYANVHVGGILRSSDGGESWEPTIDIHADVHQVITHPTRPTEVLAASARGLAQSKDRGESWAFSTDGLAGGYCRAVAVSGETVLITASRGPSGAQATLYRRVGDGPFERCRTGLPEWFPSNIDTHCLSMAGDAAVFGTGEGQLFRSEDRGVTWELVADGLPPVRCVAIA